MSIKLLVSKLGIPVAQIGIDGQYNVKENMQYTYGLGSEDLNTFSVCVRFNVEFLRPHLSTIFSYSTFISDNTLDFKLKLHNEHDEITLEFCKYKDSGLRIGIKHICSEKKFKPITNFINYHNTWHHACWLFNTDGIDSEKIKLTTKLFFDGNEENQGDIPFINMNFL